MGDDLGAAASPPGAEPDETARAQKRLRDLLNATTTIVERLDLEVVLHRVVESAMALVDARYGALGVIAADGHGLERFIHIGVDAATVARIGRPPDGRGVLGAVVAERAPIRLEHLADDPRFEGLPAHHPAMDSFLGVPIRVGEQVYGNLYLSEGARGPFTPDDEELVVALAATAGIAVENARLYDLARSREVWSATTAEVMAAMLEVSGEDVLEVIVERVDALIDVDVVGVAVPNGSEEFLVTTVRGQSAELWRGRVFAAEGTLASRALATRRAASVGARAPVSAGFPGLGPTVAVPLFAGQEPLGVLIIARRPHSPGFTDADLDMAFAFGAQAGVAIEIVRARDDRRRLELSRDRARIARDLHDHVIHGLFGAGLSLQAVSGTVDREASAAIETQIDALDAAIKDIRTIIFALGADERAKGRRVRDRMLDIVSELSTVMSATPRVIFTGPVDSVVSPALADDLAAVLRECLLNVVRHAGAEFVEVDLSIADGAVILCVEDDGRGIPASAQLSGLANLTDRALLRGGSCRMMVGVRGGTRIEWTAPVVTGQRGTPT